MTFSRTRRDAATRLTVEGVRTADVSPNATEAKSSRRRRAEPSLNDFNGKGDRLPAAEANGGDASLPAPYFQSVQQGDQNARAGGAQRMAERDRAAVNVHFILRQPRKLGDDQR